jgi:hypothetical protein
LKHDEETCQEESRTNETDGSAYTGVSNTAFAGRTKAKNEARKETRTASKAQLKIGDPLKLKTVNPLKFFSHVRWLDGKPLEIEPYRQRIFQHVLFGFDAKEHPRFTLGSSGGVSRGRTVSNPLKNWWSRWESNPRPLECDSSALPTELRPQNYCKTLFK